MWKIVNNNLTDLSKIFNIEKSGKIYIQLTASNNNKYINWEFESEEERDKMFDKIKDLLKAEEI